MGAQLRITSKPEELTEGLFGQSLHYVFEILPYLKKRNIHPDWDVRAINYGSPPDHRIIPGVLDVAYAVGPGTRRSVDLPRFRSLHREALGNDWPALSSLWYDYFRIPRRTTDAADAQIANVQDALGVHYRGHDKVDPNDPLSNPITHSEFLVIIRDFLGRRPSLKNVFLATDDYSFYEFLRDGLDVEVVNLGEVDYFRGSNRSDDGLGKEDRAMLDCVLLSKCQSVLITSSALSAFAKVLNPDLEIYRVAASRLFSDVPYFPVSYIPVYSSPDPEVSAIIDRVMTEDWTHGPAAEKFSGQFLSVRDRSVLEYLKRIGRYIKLSLRGHPRYDYQG